MAVASRWPYRECLRAASWRRSTSFGVRYSRSRRSAFRGRRGVTVRFTMVEGLRRVLGIFTGNAPYGKTTFRITHFLRRVVNFRPGHQRGAETAGSICLDACELNHLAPLLSFLSDELAEVGRRAWKCGGAPLGKPRVHFGIGEGRIDLFVEPVNNLRRRVFRRADACPEARLIARHEFGNRRDVR